MSTSAPSEARQPHHCTHQANPCIVSVAKLPPFGSYSSLCLQCVAVPRPGDEWTKADGRDYPHEVTLAGHVVRFPAFVKGQRPECDVNIAAEEVASALSGDDRRLLWLIHGIRTGVEAGAIGINNLDRSPLR